MSIYRFIPWLNWILVISSAASSVYLWIQNDTLEKRLAELTELSTQTGIETGSNYTGHTLHRLEQSLQTIQAQVAKLNHDANQLNAKCQALQSASNQIPVNSGTFSNKPRLSNDEIEELTRQQRAQNLTKLQTYFSAETIDQDWAKETKQFIENRLLNLNHSVFLSSDCKSTLCRIEILHEDANQLRELEFQLPTLLGAELPNTMTFTEEKPDGSIVQTVYLSKKGIDFPIW